MSDLFIKSRLWLLAFTNIAMAMMCANCYALELLEAPPVVYVRQSGNDTNDGLTPQSALRTIQRAVNECVVAGSVIYVGPGIYNEHVIIGSGAGKFAISGTELQPMKIIADSEGEFTLDEPGDVVLDGNGAIDTGFELDRLIHWRIEGFIVRGNTHTAVRGYLAGMTISKCVIEVPTSSGVYITAMGDVEVSDCVFDRTIDSGSVIGITVSNASDPSAVVVTRNKAVLQGDAYRSSAYGESLSNTKQIHGVMIRSDRGGKASEIEITNNIFSDCYYGIFSNVSILDTSKNRVSNNVVVESSFSIRLDWCAYYYYLSNNIICSSYYGIVTPSYFGPTTIVRSNLEHDIGMIESGRKFELEILLGDPLFLNPSEGDFTLSSGSPGIDAGDDQYAPLVDINGHDRPVDCDNNGEAILNIGAIESVSAPNKARVVQWTELGNSNNR